MMAFKLNNIKERFVVNAEIARYTHSGAVVFKTCLPAFLKAFQE